MRIMMKKQGTGVYVAPFSSQTFFRGSGSTQTSYFGWDVDVDASGTTMVVGEYRTHSVYVYDFDGTAWNETKRINGYGADFGHSVGISDDGNTIVAGARSGGSTGQAWVFTRTGGVWSNGTQLIPSDVAPSDQLGNSVQISGDGNTIVIASNLHDTPYSGGGSMYIFHRSGGVWTEQSKLVPAEVYGYPGLGESCSLSYDGNVCAFGIQGIAKGMIFTRSGASWSQSASISLPTTNVRGTSVSHDGQRVVFAVNGHSARIYKNVSGTWTFEQSVESPVGTDSYAHDAAFAGVDGDTLIVGAFNDSSEGFGSAGAVYVYKRDGVVWTQDNKLVATSTFDGDVSDDRLGVSVAITPDGSKIVAGGYTGSVVHVFY